MIVLVAASPQDAAPQVLDRAASIQFNDARDSCARARPAAPPDGAAGGLPPATGTAGSSANIYYEEKHSGAWPQPSGVPTGVALFAEEISIRRCAEQSNNIVHWAEFDRGGHFAALEAPDLLIGDVREFFRPHR